MKAVFKPVWIHEHRDPSWTNDLDTLQSTFGLSQYLWGNMPAVDILNMKDNEGIDDLDRDISLLFAASGDIRNVVKTIAGLPDGYRGRCSDIINDINFTIVARNVLLLLTALTLEPDTAVPIMIHLWYSALIPHTMLETLMHSVLPYINDVCGKIEDKEPSSIQGKTFQIGKKSFRLVLLQKEWMKLRKFFSVSRGLTAYGAQEVRKSVMLAPSRVDYLHRALNNQPPEIRVAIKRFREDGILLPHGASRDEFDIPNPTFFQEEDVWPMGDDANAMEGWDYAEMIQHAGKAKNDVMGAFFFFLRDILLRFCNKVQDVDIHFYAFNMDALQIPNYLSQGKADSTFDRIEVSNICDRGYLGPEDVLSTFTPLLRSKSKNPKATLLMLFLNAVSEVYHFHPDLQMRRQKESASLINKFMPMTVNARMEMMTLGINSMTDPNMIRLSSCYTFFGNFDKAFAIFLKEVRMEDLTKEHGVRVKVKHTIVNAWPLRVTEKSSKEEFDLACSHSHTGTERYMEFEKTE